MNGILRAVGILLAAVASAVLFGVGVPLLWLWVASQVQPTNRDATSGLAAAVVIIGPLVSFALLVMLSNRFSRAERPPQHQAWMRSRDEIKQSGPKVTAFDQVVILATLIAGVGFEVWFFFFAHCPSGQCFGH